MKRKHSNDELLKHISKISDIVDLSDQYKQYLQPGEKFLNYISKFDGSYLGKVGMEDDMMYLLEYGIIDQIQSRIPTTSDHRCSSSIGFNPLEEVWYGWSHRALHGFKIDSECRMGNTHFMARNDDEYIEWYFKCGFNDEVSLDKVKVTKKYDIDHQWGFDYHFRKKNDDGGNVYMFIPFPKKYGKGEWVAKTLEDAKQMAIDFAGAVS